MDKLQSADTRLLDIHFVIPAYNEAQSIARVVTTTKLAFPNSKVIVVNDCSRDDTAAQAESAGATVISLPVNGGYGTALHTGLLWAYRQGATLVVTQDADGQHDPKEAIKLLAPVVSDQADLALGSRYQTGTACYRVPLSRRLGAWVFAQSVSYLTGQTITDPTSGFQCLNRKVLRFYVELQDFPERTPDADLLLYAHRCGCRIAEVPTAMYEDEGGDSMHGLWKSFFYTPKMFVAMLGMLLTKPAHRNG